MRQMRFRGVRCLRVANASPEQDFWFPLALAPQNTHTQKLSLASISAGLRSCLHCLSLSPVSGLGFRVLLSEEPSVSLQVRL